MRPDLYALDITRSIKQNISIYDNLKESAIRLTYSQIGQVVKPYDPETMPLPPPPTTANSSHDILLIALVISAILAVYLLLRKRKLKKRKAKTPRNP